MTGSNKGKVLVAHPSIPGQLFGSSVVYVYEDTAVGTAGIILNKQTNYSIRQMFADKGFIVDDVGCVYAGGPINTRAITLLHSEEWHSQNSTPVGNGLCISSDSLMFEKMSMGNQPHYWRLAVGQCGWGPGQLDEEINGTGRFDGGTPSWLVTDVEIDLLFETDGERQWELAIDYCSRRAVQSWF